jgi:hypothetical protein
MSRSVLRIPNGARAWVQDEIYDGPAIVLDYDPSAPVELDAEGPYYCHLIAKCDHEQCTDACDDQCFAE